MKPEQLNPKAREAFGKSLIDIGVSVFKGIIALITIIPITTILKGALESNVTNVSLFGVFQTMTNATYIGLILFIFLAAYIGHAFRKEGLRHIHEIENKKET